MLPVAFSVGNGATLRACRTDRFKSGLLSVSVVLPITPRNACMAPLLLSVLRRGTRSYPTMADLNRRLEYLWGTGFSVRSFHRGNSLVMGFSAELLDPSYLPQGSEDLTAAVADLIYEILFCPVLDADGLLLQAYVESEKQQQCDSIRALKNNPRAYAGECCRAQMYRDLPCGIPQFGSEEQTAAVTREELTAFWRELIANLHPMCFYIGPSDGESIAVQLRRIFAGISGEPPADSALPACIPVREVRPLELQLPVTQSQLVIGLRCGVQPMDPDYAACAVMNELLGNSPISRLFVYVREKQSLCYSCSSSYAAFTGAILISCGLAKENRRQAEDEIFRQLRMLAEGGFSAEELSAAKQALENAYLQMEDSPADLEQYFLTNALIGRNCSLQELRAGFASVHAEDVMRVASGITPDTVCFLEGTLFGAFGEEDDDEASF